MGHNNVDVSIVINHYRNPAVLKLALEYLEAWQKANTHTQQTVRVTPSVEIIVTDSETSSETQEMMREHFRHMTFLQEKKNIGFGKSVNRALRRARGEYIFIMNADIVIPRPDELNKLIGYLRENSDVGIVGPQLLNFDETHQPSAFRYYTPSIIALRRTFLGKLPWGKQRLDDFMLKHHPLLHTAPTEVDWLMGSALLTKKEYLERIGLFDERFFMYMEDVDLCRRFWRENLKVVYYPLSTMYHFHEGASRSQNIFASFFNSYTRIHLISAYKYFRKHGLHIPRYGV